MFLDCRRMHTCIHHDAAVNEPCQILWLVTKLKSLSRFAFTLWIQPWNSHDLFFQHSWGGQSSQSKLRSSRRSLLVAKRFISIFFVSQVWFVIAFVCLLFTQLDTVLICFRGLDLASGFNGALAGCEPLCQCRFHETSRTQMVNLNYLELVEMNVQTDNWGLILCNLNQESA
jgi:hypothetical protein